MIRSEELICCGSAPLRPISIPPPTLPTPSYCTQHTHTHTHTLHCPFSLNFYSDSRSCHPTPIMSPTNITVTLTPSYPGASLLDAPQCGIIVSPEKCNLSPSTSVCGFLIATVRPLLAQRHRPLPRHNQLRQGPKLAAAFKTLAKLLALRLLHAATFFFFLFFFFSFFWDGLNGRCAGTALQHRSGRNDQISPSMGLGLRISCRTGCQDALDQTGKDKSQFGVSDKALDRCFQQGAIK